jgi:CHASE3 domain sensor protein
MDPAVSAALQTNLTAIDRAIAESRTALIDQPQSASARASLTDALRQKVDVLQTTVALVNDLRRENEDDAADAAKKLGKQS